MKKLLAFGFLLMAVSFWQSCSSKEQTPEELASQTAKSYYDCLLADNYNGFLAGMADMDSMPADYREQLLTAYQQYKNELDQLHGGVATITISNVRRDSSMQLVQTFLLLHFKDSTKEEIIVPMVQRNGGWKMR